MSKTRDVSLIRPVKEAAQNRKKGREGRPSRLGEKGMLPIGGKNGGLPVRTSCGKGGKKRFYAGKKKWWKEERSRENREAEKIVLLKRGESRAQSSVGSRKRKGVKGDKLSRGGERFTGRALPKVPSREGDSPAFAAGRKKERRQGKNEKFFTPSMRGGRRIVEGRREGASGT